MTDSISILAEHAARTLPDSLPERKRILKAIRNLLKPKHPAYANIIAQLATLESAEKLQSELPLRFSKPTHNGDGHGNGGKS